MDAAVSEVDLLQVVQVPLPQHVLVDTEEVVERQVEDLRQYDNMRGKKCLEL